MAGVVGVSGEDGEGAVELLGEHDAGQLVGKGHGAEGEQQVGALACFRRPSVCGADGEVEMLRAAVALAPKPRGELLRGHLAAASIEQDELCGYAAGFVERGDECGLGEELLLLDAGVVGEA